MLSMGFFKELPEEEQALISAVYRFLGKKVVWDILKLLLEEDGLTQAELKDKLVRENISNELNCMIDLGLIVRGDFVRKQGYTYYIEDNNVNEQSLSLMKGYDLHYRKCFNNPDSIKRILKYYK